MNDPSRPSSASKSRSPIGRAATALLRQTRISADALVLLTLIVTSADARPPDARSGHLDPLVQYASPIELRDRLDQSPDAPLQRTAPLRVAERNPILHQEQPYVQEHIPTPQPSWNQLHPAPSLIPPATLPAPHASTPLSDPDATTVDPEFKRITDIETDISVPRTREENGDLPELPRDDATKYFLYQPSPERGNDTGLDWLRTEGYGPPLNFCYRPLYFEELNFERYGYSWGAFQPVLSAGRFYSNALLMPFRMVKQRPGYRTYHEHCYRPGAPAPREFPR